MCENGGTYTNLTWEKGSQLTSLSYNGGTISYAYDMEGIRTSKTVDVILPRMAKWYRRATGRL